MPVLPDMKRGKRIVEYRNRKPPLSWAEIGKLVGMERNNAKRTFERVVRLSTDIKKANGIKDV